MYPREINKKRPDFKKEFKSESFTVVRGPRPGVRSAVVAVEPGVLWRNSGNATA